ncbi:MAG: sulfatase-like hydrolase/transferase [Candidatus Omnitrophica bacterium]|nr:sulfatase-like hydrolase/transferase [Candidatus Omnitrophota bacterium]
MKMFILGIFLGYFLFFLPRNVQAVEPLKLSGEYKGSNVILIILDALRPDHLSCYGYSGKTSPNIDALADRGVIFTNAFSAASYTMPAVASIFTSLYPYSHNICLAFKDELPDNIPTLAKILNASGYKTVWFGSNDDPNSGAAKGMLNGFLARNELGEMSQFIEYHGFEAVRAWINKNRQQPFFLTVHSYMTHESIFPFLRFNDKFSRNVSAVFKDELDSLNMDRLTDVPSFISEDNKACQLDSLGLRWRRAYEIFLSGFDKRRVREFRALLDSSIYRADRDLIGGIVDELKENGLYDKTIIIITADHGNEYKEHGSINHGLTLYDECIRVPLIYYLPGLSRGMRRDSLAQSIDILPTLLSLLSIPIPAQAQGADLVGILENKSHPPANEFVFCQGSAGILSVRTKRWKYIQRGNDSLKINEELFDLKVDPAERDNLIGSRDKIARRLKERLDLWKGSLVKYNIKTSEFSPGVTDRMKESIRKTGYW